MGYRKRPNNVITARISVFNLLKRVGFAVLLVGELTTFSHAQTPDTLFTRTYGGPQDEWFQDVKQTSDGGFIACGHTESWGNGRVDAYVVKTDALGNFEWQRSYGTSEVESAKAIFETSYGYLAVVAFISYVQDSTRAETRILRLGLDGDSLSTTIYSLGIGGFIYPNSAESCIGGNYAICGRWAGQFWLMKVNEMGDSLWSRTYGSPTMGEQANRVAVLRSGYLLAGNGDHSGLAIRVDEEGDSLWSFTRVINPLDEFRGAAEAMDGSLVLGGMSNFDLWFVRLSASGEMIWERHFGDEGLWEFCNDIVIDSTDNIWAACNRSFDLEDLILLRISIDGDSVTSRTIAGQAYDAPFRIIQLQDGRLVLAGTTESFGAGLADGWLLWMDTGLPVDDRHQAMLPDAISLSAFPNPFNSTLSISLDVPLHLDVTLSLYDLLGREVDVVYRGRLASSTISYVAPAALSSGVYFLRATAGTQSVLGKVVLLK